MSDIIRQQTKDPRNGCTFEGMTKLWRLDMNIVTEKLCTKCGEVKNSNEFNKNKKTKDGLGVWCRKCTNEYLIEYRLRVPRNTEYHKVYQQTNKEKINANKKRYAKEHEEEIRAYKALWYEQNKDLTKQRAKNNRLVNPRTSKESRRALLRRYGMTHEDYMEMYDSQNGCCEICGLWFENLHIDHDHETGQVRSLLCANCNRALGMVKEKVSILEKAIAYLSRFK